MNVQLYFGAKMVTLRIIHIGSRKIFLKHHSRWGGGGGGGGGEISHSPKCEPKHKHLDFWCALLNIVFSRIMK